MREEAALSEFGKKVQYVEYNITSQLKRSLQMYEQAVFDQTGQQVEYTAGKTPFIHEDTRECPHRAPYNNEDFFECPCCLNSIPKSDLDQWTYKSGTVRKVGHTFTTRPRHKPVNDTWVKTTKPSRFGRDGELFESLDRSATDENFGGISTPNVAVAMQQFVSREPHFLCSR